MQDKERRIRKGRVDSFKKGMVLYQRKKRVCLKCIAYFKSLGHANVQVSLITAAKVMNLLRPHKIKFLDSHPAHPSEKMTPLNAFIILLQTGREGDVVSLLCVCASIFSFLLKSKENPFMNFHQTLYHSLAL